MKFSSDGQHLITVGGDGCIFIWRLSNLLTQIATNVTTSSLSSNNCNGQSVPPATSTSSSISSSFRRPLAHNLRQAQQQQHCINQASPPPQLPPHIPMVTAAAASAAVSTTTPFESIFDADGLPPWARQLIGHMSHASRDAMSHASDCDAPPSTPSGTITDSGGCLSPTSSSQPQQQRRSRAVWGPAGNTSFAIMLDGETSMLASNKPSIATATTARDLMNDETDETEEVNETITVQFPSPKVDKEFFPIKQVSFVRSAFFL